MFHEISLVDRYDIKNGGREDSWRQGLAATRNSVVKLCGHVVDAFVRQEVPATSCELFPLTLYGTCSTVTRVSCVSPPSQGQTSKVIHCV